MKKIILLLALVFTLSACGKKTTTEIVPTPTPRLFELQETDKPDIAITPTKDGHYITITVTKIPDFIKQIEYELIYSASDAGLEIEKGVGGTAEIENNSFDRKLLLGTESCTNGCKYKYDEGVTGGTLTLTLITQDGQVATIDTPFTL